MTQIKSAIKPNCMLYNFRWKAVSFVHSARFHATIRAETRLICQYLPESIWFEARYSLCSSLRNRPGRLLVHLDWTKFRDTASFVQPGRSGASY
jgi:hypothetical protein